MKNTLQQMKDEDSDVDYFDAEESLDSDNEDLEDLPYSDNDSGCGSSVVSQIQAENDDGFFQRNLSFDCYDTA